VNRKSEEWLLAIIAKNCFTKNEIYTQYSVFGQYSEFVLITKPSDVLLQDLVIKMLIGLCDYFVIF